MTVLVTGATGLVGRSLVENLLAAGCAVRAVSRHDARSDLPGAQVVASTGDLHGVDAIFVHPRAVGLHVDDLIRRASAAGVRRVVVLSAVNVDDDPTTQPSRYRGDRNAEVERAVVAGAQTGRLEVVVLRCAEFASNTLGTIGAQMRVGDEIHAAYPSATEAMIDERDIAEVARHALLRDDLAGRRLVLTGPHALTLAERVASVAAATGRPLRFVETDPARAAAGLLAAGLPEGFVAAYLAVQAEREHRPALVSPDVADVLDHPARTYADWAFDHASLFGDPVGAR
jgi:uncharacterized protein YbjT (DUF2867 family)